MTRHTKPVAHIEADAAMQCGLRYVGAGAAIIGIPARDIPPAELVVMAAIFERPLRDLCTTLLDSTLYIADTQSVLAGTPEKPTER